MGPYVLVALGLVFLVFGLVRFLYPKPPPLDFAALLGGHPRVIVADISIILGGALMLLGLWA